MNNLIGGFMNFMARTIIVFLVSYSMFHSVSTLANSAESQSDFGFESKQVAQKKAEDLAVKKKMDLVKKVEKMKKSDGIQVLSVSDDESGEPKSSKSISVAINSDGTDWPVQVIVPVAFFMTFPLCLFLVFWFRFRSAKEKQITLRTMVENGANIPTEMFLEGRSQLNPMERDRRNGILFSLSSIGLIVFFFAVASDSGVWAMGLIPLLLGIGYLINYKIAASEQNGSDNQVTEQ